MTVYTEGTLVQQTTAEYLEQKLGWQSVYAHKNEGFGPNSLLGRASDRDIVLTRPLRRKLTEFNPGLPDEAYDDAVRQITAATAMQSLIATNRDKYNLVCDGVQVSFRLTLCEDSTRQFKVDIKIAESLTAEMGAFANTGGMVMSGHFEPIIDLLSMEAAA